MNVDVKKQSELKKLSLSILLVRLFIGDSLDFQDLEIEMIYVLKYSVHASFTFSSAVTLLFIIEHQISLFLL